jgi:uncharacterized SAM-binding protein YcdF (DUF218 family)
VYLLSFLVVLVVSRSDARQPADAIVILGAAQYDGRPSPVLKARLDHGAQLFRDGWAPLIVVTGGIVRGDRMSEATAGQRYLTSLGVPPEQVVVEAEGHNTSGSMDAVADRLKGEGLSRVILVSDPFHMARLRLEGRRLGLITFTSPTETSPISSRFRTELSYLLKEAAKLPVLAIWSLIP